ncbi:MAG: sugar ABC transporter permease [Lachnospiraceae bacterium]|nr:sugar ABC transporter permease [Lachnospiraceae bacterium]
MELQANKKNIWREIWKARYIYLLLAPVVIYLLMFNYAPMYGIQIAFKDFKARLGIWGSEWVGLENFEKIFSTPTAIHAILNTLRISFGRLAFEFPMGIVIAVLLTEMPGKKVKKAYQTLFTFPHFLSWVVVGTLLRNFLASDGAINQLITSMGGESVRFLGTESLFRPMLYLTSNWKSMGWEAIIYMAAIAGIDTSLYEAAEIDGASRLQRIWHITLPGIKVTVVVMLILAVGGIMNSGFDQIFNLKNTMVYDAATTLDIYVYDLTFTGVPDYSFSTAVGLFKTIINLILMLTANKVTSMITGEKMFG